MSTWFVVQTKPRQEERAKEHLNLQGGCVFLPMTPVSKNSRQGLIHQLSPLFPGYLFLHAEMNSPILSKIRSTRGARGLLRFGETIMTVDENIITDLKRRCEQMEEEPEFIAGQFVTMKSGPFKDYQGIFAETDGDKRAIIFINLLNQQQRLVVDIADLAAA